MSFFALATAKQALPKQHHALRRLPFCRSFQVALASSAPRTFSSAPTNEHEQTLPPPPQEGIEFNALPWNLNLPQHHYYIHLTTTPMEGWTSNHYDPTTDGGILTSPSRKNEHSSSPHSLHHYSSSPLPLYPANTSINYGTTIWEGLACRRSPTSGKALVFRPQKNFQRFVNGARRMCLPEPSYELFMRSLQLVLRNNMHLLPPAPEVKTGLGEDGEVTIAEIEGGSKLYVRPMLMGSGQQLGLHPSPQISLLYFVSPTGSYFQGKAVGGLKLHLERKKSRAARGGMGSVKCAGNYASTMRPLLDAKQKGFDDNLYLELDTYHNPSPTSSSSPLHQAILQELSAANIFLVLKTGEIVTPSLDRGTILPGVTRDSVLVLAKEFKHELKPFVLQSIRADGTDVGDDLEITVSERDVRVEDLLNATEVFITGTAAEVVPIYSIATSESDEDEESFSVTFPQQEELPGGPVTTKLLGMLREVMAEKRQCEATREWLCDVFASPEDFRKGGVS
mmetsp:Transcript_25283/g.48504  ORF Transcript_25283/g.48504 Transcript_25283/m.48504 type:complete len:508 (-) Transcript_25283:225-1748(-)